MRAGRKPQIFLLLACLAFQLPAIALAAEPEIDPLAAENAQVYSSPSADESPTRLDTGYRFRFGIEFISGGTLADEGTASNLLPAILGFDLRLGVQINDLFAVMYQLSAALIDGRASVLFEVTPNRYFSVAVGVGVHASPAFDAPGTETDAAILPIRLAFNIPLSAYATKYRTAISLEANLMPGFVFSGPPVVLGQRLEFGIIGGLGFELY